MAYALALAGVEFFWVICHEHPLNFNLNRRHP
jgi:hypothetical protein